MLSHLENRRTTIKDIAEVLGLNPSTVSRALKNNPHIADATRKLVEAEARRLGYREDPALKSLVSYRWHPGRRANPTTMALILDQPGIEGEKFGEGAAIKAADVQAELMGYTLERYYVCDYPTPSALSRMLYSRGIQGVVIGRTINAYDPDAFLHDWNAFCAVAVNTGVTAFPCHSVLPNHMNAVLRLWRTLIRNGCRRIGAVLSQDLLLRVHLQEIGAVSCGLLDPMVQDPIPICFSDPGSETEKIQSWFYTHRPEVVIGRVAALKAMRDGGIRVPDDVLFVALDLDDTLTGKIAGFGFPKTIFSEALVLLDSLIRLNRSGIPEVRQVLLISPPWLPGETLPGIEGIVF